MTRNYPLPQQYQQALQKPRLSLFDHELRNGTVQADRMGLPRVRSGNFASVYKIFAGNSHYAIKCFLNAPDDIQTRYEQITGYLNKIDCEYFIKTQYIAQGIAVNGHTYPVLKIKWQDGTPLDRYIDDCVRRQDKQGIVNVRGRFLDLYRTLRSYGIAHGDLQHGNILITPQGLRLIDYDSLYVPTTALGSGHESGHPNYQHPKRTASHFNELMDTFSAIVIFTALKILAYDLTLWPKYYNGDNLLFSGKDFLNTNQSPLFRRLGTIDDVPIRRLVTAIATSCLGPYEKMPDFLDLCNEIHSADKYVQSTLLPLSPHSWTGTWEDPPVQSRGEPKPETNYEAMDNDNTHKTEDSPVADYEEGHPTPPAHNKPPQSHGKGPSWQIRIACPNCNAINDQSTALCVLCGHILSLPMPKQPPPARHQPPWKPQAAQNVSLAAKLKWSLLYFILFFLVLAAYDQTDNNRAIPRKALAYIEAGKNRLFGKTKNNSAEIAAYSKIIASTPNDAAAYLKRGDAYMKAGRVTEAVNDYKAAALLGIHAAARGETARPQPATGDNRSVSD